jgi:competence protein ComFC
VLDLLLPVRCVGCREGGDVLCPGCRAALPRLLPPLCARCGAPTAWPVARCRECAGRRLAFTRARAAVAYEGRVCRVVAAWKERGLRRLAGEAAAVVVEGLPRPDVDALVFVPADSARGLARGHRPAERLAHELAAAWGLPCEPLLRRAGASRPQRGLSLADRRRNVRNAFSAENAAGRLVLVDDVYTTGATAHSASAALNAAGASNVEVVTFARAVRRD